MSFTQTLNEDELSKFCKNINKLVGSCNQLTIYQARDVVQEINNFLYTNYEGIGTTFTLGNTYNYLSDFHKYWELHHKEILNCQIDEHQCELVADALHNVFIKTNGTAFKSLYDTCGLSPEDICRIRLLTANQDFRGSRSFDELAKIYNSDPSIFDEGVIAEKPEDFVKRIGISNLSQNDKRISYAQKIANFVLSYKCSPYKIIEKFDWDLIKFRTALINCTGSGYGNKKTDMFIRDMVVLNIWNDTKNFDKIDVASDINTIKVALRTSIIKTEIPLVSSFLDIFCHQYVYIDEMNTKAWRKVWEFWVNNYPTETISSPCLIDYFVYQVIGRQFCKEILYEYKCDSNCHTFKWHSSSNRTCQVCYNLYRKRVSATLIRKIMPCIDSQGSIAILQTPFNKAIQLQNQKIDNCPFAPICGNNKKLMPPKSISILGQTGWTTAYTQKDNGGGGLMA